LATRGEGRDDEDMDSCVARTAIRLLSLEREREREREREDRERGIARGATTRDGLA